MAAILAHGYFQIDFLCANCFILIQISSKLVFNGSVNTMASLVQVMAWCRICIRPWWVIDRHFLKNTFIHASLIKVLRAIKNCPCSRAFIQHLIVLVCIMIARIWVSVSMTKLVQRWWYPVAGWCRISSANNLVHTIQEWEIAVVNKKVSLFTLWGQAMPYKCRVICRGQHWFG